MKNKKIELSKREQEVLQCLMQGYNNKNTAIQLKIDDRSVSTYLSRLKTKLGLINNDNSNTFIVVATAIKKGLTTYDFSLEENEA